MLMWDLRAEGNTLVDCKHSPSIRSVTLVSNFVSHNPSNVARIAV